MDKWPRWLMDAVVIVVTGIWVITTIYAMVNPRYAPPSMVQFAMSAVLAAVLGNQAIKIARRNGNGK